MNIKIIVIVGLPGSGKTTLSEQFKKDGYIIHDDFITNFHNRNLIKDIRANKKVCINDPRLCFMNRFEDYIIKRIVIKEKINLKHIKLILFENKPNECKFDTKKISKESHNIYSLNYKLENYMEWNPIILDICDFDLVNTDSQDNYNNLFKW